MDVRNYISDVVNEISYSAIDMIFAKAGKMEDVVNLAMGQPDFNTPDQASSAGIWAIENHKTKYTDDLGIEELREEISRYQMRKYGLEYNPHNEIIVLSGVSSAIDTTLRAIVNPGDEVLVHQPGFNIYVPAIMMARGTAVPVGAYMEEGFKLNAEKVRAAITTRTKALIISYPNNPTGAVMTRDELMAIRDVVHEAGILVISDEIYSEMVHEGEFVSFASLPGMKDRTILLNGVSKTFSMPGWRIGYACAHKDIIDALFKVHQNTAMNAVSISQYAAAEALKSCDNYSNEVLKVYKERKEYVMGRLRAMGLECLEPQGAFYVFPSIKNTGLDSGTFCDRLLEEASVAVVPGTEFGSCGEGHFRLSYTTTMENLAKGLDRIEEFLKSLRASK